MCLHLAWYELVKEQRYLSICGLYVKSNCGFYIVFIFYRLPHNRRTICFLSRYCIYQRWGIKSFLSIYVSIKWNLFERIYYINYRKAYVHPMKDITIWITEDSFHGLVTWKMYFIYSVLYIDVISDINCETCFCTKSTEDKGVAYKSINAVLNAVKAITAVTWTHEIHQVLLRRGTLFSSLVSISCLSVNNAVVSFSQVSII